MAPRKRVRPKTGRPLDFHGGAVTSLGMMKLEGSPQFLVKAFTFFVGDVTVFESFLGGFDSQFEGDFFAWKDLMAWSSFSRWMRRR